jgi:multidrug efflux pump subunit AcrA (membrane-fusion protein)
MIRHWFIQLSVVTMCVALLAGCGKKEAETTTAPEPGSQQKDTVELTDESRNLAHIEVITITRTNLNLTLSVPGRISYDLNHTAKVSSPFAGRILKMNYDIGATVKQGDVMALIDSPDLLKPLELKAPLDGTVTERQGTVGEMLDNGKEFYTLSDVTTVWCIADLNEKDIAAARAEELATVHVLAYPEEGFTGKITLVGGAVDEKTRRIDVRIEVGNTSNHLKPGMFADVAIVTGSATNVLAVPEESLQRIDEQDVVFVAGEKSRFTKRVVTLGHTESGQTEILNGLNDGERVVATGSILLKSELLKSELGE